MFAVCAPTRPSRSLANNPEGTIYLRGNLGETTGNSKATNLRNQVQLRSCHLRTVSQKAVPHEVLIFSYDSAFHTVSVVGFASSSVRSCILLCGPACDGVRSCRLDMLSLQKTKTGSQYFSRVKPLHQQRCIPCHTSSSFQVLRVCWTSPAVDLRFICRSAGLRT